ncbi:MAG: hypothetical protein HYY19_06580, partial [Candidatus Rokubacteria bacterium]|nr:hypothetical protein [Candidatus Rokubacteria bacterium]
MTKHVGSRESAAARVRFAPVDGAPELFSPAFLEYLARLHDLFTPRVHELRAGRAEMLSAALHRGRPPGALPVSEINTGDWRVPPLPEELW